LIDDLSCFRVGNSPAIYKLQLNNIATNVLLDNGSDRSLISQGWLNRFQRSNNLNLEISNLKDSIAIRLADQETEIQTDSFVLLSLTFNVYDNLHLRNRMFFIVQNDIGIPIIGNSELSEIGIDPISTLDRLSFIHEDEIESEDIEANLNDDD